MKTRKDWEARLLKQQELLNKLKTDFILKCGDEKLIEGEIRMPTKEELRIETLDKIEKLQKFYATLCDHKHSDVEVVNDKVCVKKKEIDKECVVLKSMKLHDKLVINPWEPMSFVILRVIGGWIYCFNSDEKVFVKEV